MDQSISNQFRVALTYLLAQEGRGAQARLANQQKIDRGYLNAIVKGRKSGSEKMRSKIAGHFSMAYEDMFILGRRILEGAGEATYDYEKYGFDILTTAEPSRRLESGKKTLDFKAPTNAGEDSSSIQDRILKVIELLESGTIYGDLLAGLVDAFHETLATKKENLALQNQMKELESRIIRLEGKLDCEKGYLEKSV